MSEYITEMSDATEKAVNILKAYARYIYDHAENIIGNVDSPNYVTDDEGIRIAFTVCDRESVPLLEVSHRYIVLEAVQPC